MSRVMVVVVRGDEDAEGDDDDDDNGVEAERYLGGKNQQVMDRAESSKEEGG